MLALGAVAAIAVGLPDSTPAGAPAAPNTAVTAGAAQAAQSAASAAHPAASTAASPVAVATKARPQLPPGQVWECEVNGQRVFSDVQCGAHATVRQLAELNVFDPSAAYGPATPRPYRDGPGPGYYTPSMPASDVPIDDSDAGGGDPIYSQVIVVHDRAARSARHDHPHPRAAAHRP